MKNNFCSIVIASYIPNAEREEMFKTSLQSLLANTVYPFELIVVDNGGSKSMTEFLLKLVSEKKINTYVANQNNMHFGYARNQGIALSKGNYVCIADNDILYHPGWLRDCVEILEDNPNQKLYTTPMAYPMVGLNSRYHKGYLKHKGNLCELNTRAGSNCFVIRRRDLDEIGHFTHHRIAGSHWTDSATLADFTACVLPHVKAEDMGLRKGYNLKHALPIKLDVHNLGEVYFNQDDFRKHYPDLNYYD